MNEHLIRLAERFGMSHKETAMDRRTFLKGLLATGALVAAPSGLLMPREAKIHQVGGEIVLLGLTFKMQDGSEVRISDFREEDKYDTVWIPSYDNSVVPVTDLAKAAHDIARQAIRYEERPLTISSYLHGTLALAGK